MRLHVGGSSRTGEVVPATAAAAKVLAGVKESDFSTNRTNICRPPISLSSANRSIAGRRRSERYRAACTADTTKAKLAERWPVNDIAVEHMESEVKHATTVASPFLQTSHWPAPTVH